MRLVVALGGNALLRRGEPLDQATQRRNVTIACRTLAGLARAHDLVVTHGNGPQIGLLALQAAAYHDVAPYPLDVLGAESEGMIGYLIEQELAALLPGRELATLLTQVEVAADDPAFATPSKPIGPVYDEATARRLAGAAGWTVAPDGMGWRRVVASPQPRRIVELATIRLLAKAGVIVICAGGGGIPTHYEPGEDRRLTGVEAVIDKDLASSLLARELEADVFVMATDVDGVYRDWGSPSQTRIERATPAELESMDPPDGSMGPKVAAATEFVGATGQRAAIGALHDIDALVAGTGGTQVVKEMTA